MIESDAYQKECRRAEIQVDTAHSCSETIDLTLCVGYESAVQITLVVASMIPLIVASMIPVHKHNKRARCTIQNVNAEMQQN